MKKLIIITVTVLAFTNNLNAQIFEKKEFYPGIKTIKGKYYNGSGGGGFWSIVKLDSLGRTIEKESYWKDELRARYCFDYNSNNDKLYYITNYSINDPNRIDTVACYEYKYQEDKIVYQKSTSSRLDTTVIRLIDNKADTVLVYQRMVHYFRPKTDTTVIYEETYTFKYQNGLLVRSQKFDVEEQKSEITYFEYYPNGMLKRRKIEHKPEPEFKGTYIGGPGSDDMSYKYKFDKFGRVKKLYYIIGKKKYKIAVYEYSEK